MIRIDHSHCTHHSRGVHPFTNQPNPNNHNNNHRHKPFKSRIQFITLQHTVYSFMPFDNEHEMTDSTCRQNGIELCSQQTCMYVYLIGVEYVDVQ